MLELPLLEAILKRINCMGFCRSDPGIISEVFGGAPTPRGGVPTTQNRLFLTHRTTHSAKIFGREAPKNGAEGAVLENFRDFSENCFLKLQ